MNFETYLKKSWQDHHTDFEKVAADFPNRFALVEANEQLAQFVGLITHVMGQHLAKWDEGAALLSKSLAHPKMEKGSETERTILRSIASLHLAAGQSPDLKSFNTSDQIRIFAGASAFLSEIESSRAGDLLRKALQLAEKGLEKTDSANRALAVTGNNMAGALEEKTNRTAEATELMILAAQTGRKFWEIAGTWLEVNRAEYRLAMSYLQAHDLAAALRHAQFCIEICNANNADSLDMFFGYAALAQVEKQRHNRAGFQNALAVAKSHFEKLSDDDKPWYEDSLIKLANE